MVPEHCRPLQRRAHIHRRHVLALAGTLAPTVALTGCLSDDGEGNGNSDTSDNDDDSDDDTDDPPEYGDVLDELVTGNRQFAFDLSGELISAEPGANLFCSPYSISVALAMTYAGARGETETQMAETLRYTLGDDVHGAIEALAAELDDRSEIDAEDESSDDGEDGDPFELTVENTVWGQEGYPFYEEYRTLLEDHYGAGLQEVDYVSDPEAARETINEWVEAQTEGKIDELLPGGSIDQYVRLVLTNAIYFQAAWETPFEEGATETSAFTALDGSTAEVPLMRQSGSFAYADVDGHQVIELPYVGEEVGMVVVLPEVGNFEAFEAELDADRFDALVDELEMREGEIRLPRFAFDSGFSLREILSSMGMSIAFDDVDANFSGMADLEETGEHLFIHDVYHDAHVAVDEAGTEAAAATGVVVGTESAPTDPFEMVVDRPFWIAIRDRPTDALLFLGRVVDAGEAQ